MEKLILDKEDTKNEYENGKLESSSFPRVLQFVYDLRYFACRDLLYINLNIQGKSTDKLENMMILIKMTKQGTQNLQNCS